MDTRAFRSVGYCRTTLSLACVMSAGATSEVPFNGSTTTSSFSIVDASNRPTTLFPPAASIAAGLFQDDGHSAVAGA